MPGNSVHIKALQPFILIDKGSRAAQLPLQEAGQLSLPLGSTVQVHGAVFLQISPLIPAGRTPERQAYFRKIDPKGLAAVNALSMPRGGQVLLFFLKYMILQLLSTTYRRGTAGFTVRA